MIFPVAGSQMATTGALPPQAAQTISESPWSDETWVSPENIYGAGEASVTTTQFDAGDQTYVLKAYNFNLSSVPDGATILGVICVINARYANAPASIDLVQLLDISRAKGGTNKAATPTALTTLAANYTFGSTSDTWDNALTTTWIKDADFGVAIGCLAGGSGNNNVDVFIDSVTLEIVYRVSITDNQSVFIKGKATALDNQPVYLVGNPPSYQADDHQPIYLKGKSSLVDNQTAYVHGKLQSIDNQPVYAKGFGTILDNQPVYFIGRDFTEDHQAVYARGGLLVSGYQSAFLLGSFNAIDNQPIYLHGKQIVSTSHFPSTPILDDFNRDDGPVGDNWNTPEGGTDGYIVSQKLSVPESGVGITWNEYFGPGIEFFFTQEEYTDVIYYWGVISNSANPTSGSYYSIDIYTPLEGYHSFTLYDGNGDILRNLPYPATGDHIVGIRHLSDGQLFIFVYLDGVWQLKYQTTNLDFPIAGYIAFNGYGWSGGYLDNFGGGNISGLPEGQWGGQPLSIFAQGQGSIVQGQSCYARGQEIASPSSISIYLLGSISLNNNQACYLSGTTSGVGSNHQAVYLSGMAQTQSSQTAYILGSSASVDHQPIYVRVKSQRVSGVGLEVEYNLESNHRISSAGLIVEYHTPPATRIITSVGLLVEYYYEEQLPGSDVIVNEWRNEAGGSELYSHIDEFGNQAEYVTSGSAPQVGDSFVVALLGLGDDYQGDGTHWLEWEAYGQVGSTFEVKCELIRGDDYVIVTDIQTLTTSVATYSHQLTAEEVGACVGWYETLRVRITITGIS